MKLAGCSEDPLLGGGKNNDSLLCIESVDGCFRDMLLLRPAKVKTVHSILLIERSTDVG